MTPAVSYFINKGYAVTQAVTSPLRPGSNGGGGGLKPVQSMWDFWWTNWHWDCILFAYIGYRDYATGLTVRNSNCGRDSRCFVPQTVQTGSATHQPSYPTGTGDLSSRVKRPEREVDHKTSSNAEVNNEWHSLQL